MIFYLTSLIIYIILDWTLVSSFSVRLLFNMIAMFFLPLQWPFWKCIVVSQCWSILASVSYLVLFRSCWTAQAFAVLLLHSALISLFFFCLSVSWNLAYSLPGLTITIFNLFSLVSLVSIEFFLVPISLDGIWHWCHTFPLWKVLFRLYFLTWYFVSSLFISHGFQFLIPLIKSIDLWHKYQSSFNLCILFWQFA